MRWVTVLFAIIAFLWWILQLVSIFITPPGLHARGSVFFAFGYATMSLAVLAVALLFFAVPSKSIRVLSGVLSGLLVVDTIIILAVSHLRQEEAFVGSASVICKSILLLRTFAFHVNCWPKSHCPQANTRL